MKKNTNHGYESQSKIWKPFAASGGVLYPPLCGIVQLTNSAASKMTFRLLRFRNWSFSNKLFAVSTSIVIHLAIGSLLILGLLSDRHFTPDLRKLNLAWVSLESGNGKATISPQEKKTDRNQFPAERINAVTTTSTAKNMTVQDQTAKEENGSKAAGKESSTNVSGTTAMPTAGNSAAFVSASPLYRENTPPIYPAIAKLRGYAGVVLVNAEILPDGRVGSTEVSKSSGYAILDKSAIEAVKLWKFEPAKKAGKPFAIRVKLPIKFVLHDDNSPS